MKTKIFTAAIFLFLSVITSNVYSQNSLFSGNLTCSIGGNPFSGKVTLAIYNNADDAVVINLENETGGLFQLMISYPKKMVQQQLPYSGSFEVHYPRLTTNSEDIMFYLTYEPDKNVSDKKYLMLNSTFKLNKFDLELNIIQFEFTAAAITGVLQPDGSFRETDRITIDNAVSDNIKFMGN